MKKTIGIFLYGMSCLFSSAYALPTNVHSLTLGPSIDIQLPPNEPQCFLNSFIWTVKAKCTLTSNEPVIRLSFSVLRKSGMVNDINLSTGDAVSMVFAANDQVEISAASGGKVEMTNTGEEMVTASCYSM